MVKRIDQRLMIRQAQVAFKPDDINSLFDRVGHGAKNLMVN